VTVAVTVTVRSSQATSERAPGWEGPRRPSPRRAGRRTRAIPWSGYSLRAPST